MTRATTTLIVLAVVITAVAAGEGIFYWRRTVQVSELRGKDSDLERQITAANEALTRREKLLAEHGKVKTRVERYQTILPAAGALNDDTTGGLMSQWARKVDLQLTGFKRLAGATDEETGVTRHDFRLTLRGSFDQFVRFLRELEKHETFYEVSSFSLTPGGRASEGSAELNITATVTTFTVGS